MTGHAALVVDDDAVTRLVLGHMLRRLGWDVAQAADTPEAIEELHHAEYDLVVCDYHLPSGTGIDVLDSLDDAQPRPKFMLVSGMLDFSTDEPAIACRLEAQLTKPVGSEALRATLDKMFPAVAV